MSRAELELEFAGATIGWAAEALEFSEPEISQALGVDRKTRTITLSIKAKDNAETQGQMARLQAEAPTGTTNLGALLKAKLDTQNR